MFWRDTRGIAVGYWYPAKPETTQQDFEDASELLSTDPLGRGDGSSRDIAQGRSLQLPQLPTFNLFMNSTDVK